MTELEQLRKEVNELRERLALLEARKDRLEGAEYDHYRKERDALYRAWADKQPPWPLRPTPIRDSIGY
jgi:predicted nuclease with TOPRIM domain